MELEKTIEETIANHDLLGKKDKVAVAYSGGKDSTTLLHILKKLGFCPEALTVDVGIKPWSEKNIENIQAYCESQEIPLTVISMEEEIGANMEEINRKIELKPCTSCGILKKWLLNKTALQKRFDAIATGHNLDDEAQTVIMNIMDGKPGLNQTLGPKSRSRKGFVTRIKPLYFCHEKEIKAYSRKQGFPVQYEPCPLSESAYRKEVREMLDRLEDVRATIKEDIVKQFLKTRKGPSGQTENCINCGSPSRKGKCSACKITEGLNG